MQIEKAKEIISAWNSGCKEFAVHSSGSTGSPKKIYLQREWIEWSAEQTAGVLHPESTHKCLVCLPLDKVGGLMMLLRSLIWGLKAEIIEAVSNPLKHFVDADIVSLTPYQLHHILQDKRSTENLKRFKRILIGGGELPQSLEQKIKNFGTGAGFWQTYGMTETYSHIALRKINEPDSEAYFIPFPEVELKTDSDSCALLKVPFSKELIRTNDIIELKGNNGFRVMGRSDFVINSGGVKLHPQQIENEIDRILQPESLFIISSKKDPILGNKLVLVCETNEDFKNQTFDFLKPLSLYSVPKEIVEIVKMPLNSGGKPDRKAVWEQINR